MLAKSRREIIRLAAVIAKQHHEKWDGSGYPEGLSGEDISIRGQNYPPSRTFSTPCRATMPIGRPGPKKRSMTTSGNSKASTSIQRSFASCLRAWTKFEIFAMRMATRTPPPVPNSRRSEAAQAQGIFSIQDCVREKVARLSVSRLPRPPDRSNTAPVAKLFSRSHSQAIICAASVTSRNLLRGIFDSM